MNTLRPVLSGTIPRGRRRATFPHVRGTDPGPVPAQASFTKLTQRAHLELRRGAHRRRYGRAAVFCFPARRSCRSVGSTSVRGFPEPSFVANGVLITADSMGAGYSGRPPSHPTMAASRDPSLERIVNRHLNSAGSPHRMAPSWPRRAGQSRSICGSPLGHVARLHLPSRRFQARRKLLNWPCRSIGSRPWAMAGYPASRAVVAGVILWPAAGGRGWGSSPGGGEAGSI
jgi:hypothetical protein